MAEDVVLNKERPLAGVVLCCTSILPERRAELARIASQMGAVHKFDLTSDVTHLIVGEPNTPKYKYVAKERADVKVLRPEWVGAVRSSWILGEDTNLPALEEEYRFPTFGGLSICLTGFEDMSFRAHLQHLVTTNGAEFRKDLTKSVSHLVARVGEGQKYKFASLWNIRVVSLRWLNDSLERGMVLDESLYDLLIPDDKQGVGAWNRMLTKSPEKRTNTANISLPRPRKLRRVASAKLGSQNEGIWPDIFGRSLEISADLEIKNHQQSVEVRSITNTRHALPEARSFSSEIAVTERLGTVTQKLSQPPSRSGDEHRRRFWSGSCFFISGFSTSKTKILEDLFLSHDASMVSSLTDLACHNANNEGGNVYILVPFNLDRSKIPSTDEIDFEPEIVTDMWIEKCLENKALVVPEAHITSTPFPIFPIPAFHGLKVCSTGFVGIDLLHLSKLVNLMGACYEEYFSPDASVLICNAPNQNNEKMRFAYEWNVPAVVADWLWISVQTGEKKSFEPYLVSKKPPVKDNPPLYPKTEKPGKTPDHDLNGLDRLQAEGPDRLSENNDVQAHRNASSPLTRLHVDDKEYGEKDHTLATQESGVQNGNNLQGMLINSPKTLSRSLSKSPTPLKEQALIPTGLIPQHERNSKSCMASHPPTSLDMAISELLKRKRERSKVPSVERADCRRPIKRRPLLGRANSQSLSRAATAAGGGAGQQKGISRASSIDTLNEDGYGSVVDGVDSPSKRANNNALSFVSILTDGKTNKNETQQLLETRLDPFHNLSTHHEFDGPDGGDESTLPMTQLGYEDADAIAMREKITKRVGQAKNVEGKPTTGEPKPTGGVVIGMLRDHELLEGWSKRRRTRSWGRDVPGERF